MQQACVSYATNTCLGALSVSAHLTAYPVKADIFPKTTLASDARPSMDASNASTQPSVFSVIMVIIWITIHAFLATEPFKIVWHALL